MKSTKLILLTVLICSLITNFYYYNRIKGMTTTYRHDYYLDVDQYGYQLYDMDGNRHVANWQWNENEQLDGVIEEDNQ